MRTNARRLCDLLRSFFKLQRPSASRKWRATQRKTRSRPQQLPLESKLDYEWSDSAHSVTPMSEYEWDSSDYSTDDCMWGCEELAVPPGKSVKIENNGLEASSRTPPLGPWIWDDSQRPWEKFESEEAYFSALYSMRNAHFDTDSCLSSRSGRSNTGVIQCVRLPPDVESLSLLNFSGEYIRGHFGPWERSLSMFVKGCCISAAQGKLGDFLERIGVAVASGNHRAAISLICKRYHRFSLW